MPFCTVITDSKSPGISGGLTYEVDEEISIGSPVRVPLRNKIVEGIVIDVKMSREKQEYDLKKVKELIATTPFISESHIKTAQWMADYYRCSLRHALRVFLPSPPWSQLLPKEEKWYRLSGTLEKPRGSKQIAIVDYLQSREIVDRSTLIESTGASSMTIKSLLKKGVLTEEIRTEEEVVTDPPEIKRPKLTPEQEDAYVSMKAEPKPSLLFGVTGSGKTEIYAQLIGDVIESGKQAILLVPEILLTEHIIHRFEEFLDREHIAVLHSRLTLAQRRKEWRRIRSGVVSLVIGSRSALFAPLPDLGLVILDEEHEWTYKNEQTPRYHARETAETLCRLSNSKLVLGSATPSLESWSRVKSSLYHLARLPNRYNNQVLPDIRVVDLASVQFGKYYPFSPPLLEAIQLRLDKGEQSILFLNRRGMATALLCFDCRRRIVSPDSQLPFTVHHDGSGHPYLLDHTSGLKCALPTECPSCKSLNVKPVGAGTQRIEIILEQLFPGARLLRADSDTLTHPEHMRLLLKKMREGQADILLGTQSVVKGLDLPGVTLSAVLIADIGLSLPHFRAGERTFQLLSQLAGRSGRAKKGEVIIQTFRPDATEIRLAAEHKTEDFLEQELKLRIHTEYPPATKMVRLIFRGPDSESRAKIVSKSMDVPASPTFFGGGREWHILLRGEKVKSIPQGDFIVDVDPIDCV